MNVYQLRKENEIHEEREDLEKKLEESTEHSKSLKETVLTLFGKRK
jgi:hypothetical protein